MNNREKNFISAVVYVHNAEERIIPFLQMLIAELETNFEHSEIICVNDFSEDDSVQKIKEIRVLLRKICPKRYPKICHIGCNTR